MAAAGPPARLQPRRVRRRHPAWPAGHRDHLLVRHPRALAEQVMAQIEDPANLDRWDDPAARLITIILIRRGLRLGDALALPRDCLARDADGAAYLRYFNHKMKREALVPID